MMVVGKREHFNLTLSLWDAGRRAGVALLPSSPSHGPTRKRSCDP
jgi:hypothetical protein